MDKMLSKLEDHYESVWNKIDEFEKGDEDKKSEFDDFAENNYAYNI